MPGKRRSTVDIAAGFGNKVIDNITALERHWKGLSPNQQVAIIDPIEQAQKQADVEPPVCSETLLALLAHDGPDGEKAASEIRYLRAELARLREDYQALKDSYNEGAKLVHDYCHEFKVGRLGHSVIAEAILDARRLREGLKWQPEDFDSRIIRGLADNNGIALASSPREVVQCLAREIQRHRALVTK